MRAGPCSVVGATRAFLACSSCRGLLPFPADGSWPARWTLTFAERLCQVKPAGIWPGGVTCENPVAFSCLKPSRVGLFRADTTCVERQVLELQLPTEGSGIHWDPCPALEPASPTAGFFSPHPHVVFVCQPFINTLKMICCEFVFQMNVNTTLQQLQLHLLEAFPLMKKGFQKRLHGVLLRKKDIRKILLMPSSFIRVT